MIHRLAFLFFVVFINVALYGQRKETSKKNKLESDTLVAVLLPQSEDANTNYSEFQWNVVDGISFLDRLLWKPEEVGAYVNGWSEYQEEYSQQTGKHEVFRLKELDIAAEYLYLNGCINSIDMTNPAWGGGDGYRNFFIGDTAGFFRIGYKSGYIDEIPMVFGYTVWWHESYKGHPEPFRSVQADKKLLDDALCVVNGIDGYNHEKDEYYLKIALRDEKVSWIEFEDNPKRYGYYRVDGLSFGNLKNISELDKNTFLLKEYASDVSLSKRDCINNHFVFSVNPFPKERQMAIGDLKQKFYTRLSDIDKSVIRSCSPDVKPKDFLGPKITFSGSAIATLLTRIYYENSMEILNRIDEDGMVHESGKDADNYQSFGSWNEGLGAFYTDAYTRNRSLTVLTNYNFQEEVNAAIGFFDKWMMYYPQAYPDIQLGGKPVPGHASVIANTPHVYFDKLQHLGWRTQYKVRDFGNPENDGHGFLMLTRYRVWSKQGRTREWIDKRWEAINEAAEYIPWCLDNPDLSFSENGLLHNETEGGMMQQSMFCDYLCYLGLLAYSEMAEVANYMDKAKRWTEQAKRLYNAMEAYYPARIEPWGDVWDPAKNAMFHYINSTLAPACMGMDYYGYDVMNILPEEWTQRTRRTYRMQLSKCKPEFAASAGLGYGQCYISQTGLLLDEMSDADKMIKWMAGFSFTPGLDHPYRVPEGATVSEDGKTWRRWGDLGNLYQMVDVVHTLHIMFGIDDIRPELLTLMPRLTSNINAIKIEDWPVRIMSNGISVLADMDVQMKLNRSKKEIVYSVKSTSEIDNAKLRLGPIPKNAGNIRVWKNGQIVNVTKISSGDSDWVWIDFGEKNTKEYKFKLKYK